jgi:hypothetical protein
MHASMYLLDTRDSMICISQGQRGGQRERRILRRHCFVGNTDNHSSFYNSKIMELLMILYIPKSVVLLIKMTSGEKSVIVFYSHVCEYILAHLFIRQNELRRYGNGFEPKARIWEPRGDRLKKLSSRTTFEWSYDDVCLGPVI